MQQLNVSDQTISAGLGEVKVSADQSRYLACFGIGSCICLCAFDRVAKVAGMAHIVLPESKSDNRDMTATKFADIAVPVLLDEMFKEGASKADLIVKLAGGAQMIQSPGFNSVLDMGKRNLEATRKLLKERGIRIAAEDVCGTQGRTVWLSVATGEMMVRTAGQSFNPL